MPDICLVAKDRATMDTAMRALQALPEWSAGSGPIVWQSDANGNNMITYAEAEDGRVALQSFVPDDLYDLIAGMLTPPVLNAQPIRDLGKPIVIGPEPLPVEPTDPLALLGLSPYDFEIVVEREETAEEVDTRVTREHVLRPTIEGEPLIEEAAPVPLRIPAKLPVSWTAKKAG